MMFIIRHTLPKVDWALSGHKSDYVNQHPVIDTAPLRVAASSLSRDRLSYDGRRGIARYAPELVRGSSRPDVQRVTGRSAVRVAGRAGLEQHDLVELEPLRLPHVGDVDAGLPGEVLGGHLF